MLINYNLSDTDTPLQQQQLTELESLASKEWKTNGRRIFSIHNSIINRIKWNKPTKAMLNELHNKTQPKTVFINTESNEYLNNCNTELTKADHGYAFLTRMYTRLSHTVLNLRTREQRDEVKNRAYQIKKDNAS